jgi:hypothetical protein
LQHHIIKLTVTREDIAQCVCRSQVQQSIYVTQFKITIDQQHFVINHSQCSSQVDCHIGLANATLAPGNGNGLHRSAVLHRRWRVLEIHRAKARKVDWTEINAKFLDSSCRHQPSDRKMLRHGFKLSGSKSRTTGSRLTVSHGTGTW